MALTVYASTGSTTTQLNDGNPFRLESAEGLSGADVIRHEQGGPFQHGVTDLGFRFQARVMTLQLLFYASTAILRDTYRATLMAAFKPLDSTSIFLSVQRDDSEIRTLTCFTVGDIDIELLPEYEPGNLHRATINLRAASPLWRANSVTIGSADFITALSWWLAGGSIAAANVKAHYDNPVASSSYVPFAGNITGDWSIAFVTKPDPYSAAAHYVYDNALGPTGTALFRSKVANFYEYGTALGPAATWPGTTDNNYHVIESRSGTQFWRYWTSSTLTGYATANVDIPLTGGGAWAIGTDWFSSTLNWAFPILRFAIFGTVSTTQLQALGPYILGTPNGTATVVNDGDTYAYPLITLRGPVTNPVIVNTTVGGTIDLSGVTLGSADTWTIDLRSGNKQIYNQNGSVMLGSATTLPTQLASFALAPAPVAAGGTNVLTLSYGTAGTATQFIVQITPQYMSF